MNSTFSRWQLAVVLLVSCSPSRPATTGGSALPDEREAFGGVQCSAVRPQTEPDVMAWDPGSRLALKDLSDQGVVAVRYEATGCDVRLELLTNRIGEGSYEYKPYAATQSKLARNAQELFTELPLGAASLAGKLKSGRALRTNYMLVGARSIPAGAAHKRTMLPDESRLCAVPLRVGLVPLDGNEESSPGAAVAQRLWKRVRGSWKEPGRDLDEYVRRR